MTIHILDISPEEIAKSLDDNSLDKMIKSIAQTLCNVHHMMLNGFLKELDRDERFHAKYFLSKKIPLGGKNIDPEELNYCKWSQWSQECVANYEWLARLAWELCREYHFRNVDKCKADMQSFDDQWDCGAHHKLKAAIEWARDNVPELPRYFDSADILLDVDTDNHCGSMTPFPLVMTEKFKHNRTEIILDYIDKTNHNTVKAYRNYYNHLLNKSKKKTWTRREKPEWVKL